MVPLKQVVHLATEGSFKEAMVAFRQAICLPPLGVSYNIFPWICWAIWTVRNLAIFEHRYLTPMEIATNGIRLALEWVSAQNKSVTTGRSIPASRRKQHEPSRDPAVITCKSDAAFDKNSNQAGLAWILTASNGSRLNQGSMVQDSVNSPLVAEALALRSGILSAVNLEISKLHMLSDNETLIRAITNDKQISEIFGIVQDIQMIATVFVEITFNHISRLRNVDADLLAKQTLSISSVMDSSLG